MAFEVPQLPFDGSALEPALSARTIELHHSRHHRGYIARLNELLIGSRLAGLSLEELITVTADPGLCQDRKREIFQNAAQVWNHTFYWYSISETPSRPTGGLLHRIKEDFGGLNGLKHAFLTVGGRHFAAGWLWLILGRDGRLSVEDTQDADCPIARGEIPLFACDLWEHAYYLDYQNARNKYLEAFWELIDWRFVALNLARRSIPNMSVRLQKKPSKQEVPEPGHHEFTLELARATLYDRRS